MKLEKIENSLMVETNCAIQYNTPSGKNIEKKEKTSDYYNLLDEKAKLSQIRTSKWINFWSIFYIVVLSVGFFIASVSLIEHRIEKQKVKEKLKQEQEYKIWEQEMDRRDAEERLKWEQEHRSDF